MKVVRIVVDGELPLYCGDCKLVEWEYKRCTAAGKDITTNLIQAYNVKKRPSWCPLVTAEEDARLKNIHDVFAFASGSRMIKIEKESEE